VYVGCSSGLVALEATHGVLRWIAPTAGVVFDSPAVDEETGYVFFTSGDELLWCVRGDTGAMVFSVPFTGYHSTPSLALGRAYAIANGTDALTAFDKHTGDVVWVSQVQVGTGMQYSGISTVPAAGLLVFAVDNMLAAYRAADGTLAFTAASGTVPDAGPPASPAVGPGGVIFWGAADGNLRVLSSSGVRQWNYQSSGSIVAQPVVSSAAVFFVTDVGDVYSVSLSGSLLVRFPLGGGGGGGVPNPFPDVGVPSLLRSLSRARARAISLSLLVLSLSLSLPPMLLFALLLSRFVALLPCLLSSLCLCVCLSHCLSPTLPLPLCCVAWPMCAPRPTPPPPPPPPPPPSPCRGQWHRSSVGPTGCSLSLSASGLALVGNAAGFMTALGTYVPPPRPPPASNVVPALKTTALALGILVGAGAVVVFVYRRWGSVLLANAGTGDSVRLLPHRRPDTSKLVTSSSVDVGAGAGSYSTFS
jgi:hypothetical protein